MTFILGCLIWFFVIYGVINLFKNRRKRRSTQDNVRDDYSYDEAISQDAPAARPIIDGGILHGSTDPEDYQYEDEYPAARTDNKIELLTSQFGVEGIVEEIRHNSDDPSTRRSRGMAVGSYLDKNVFGEGFYKLDMVPHDKIANAKSSMHIPDQDVILALMDDTAFGSGKEGIALTVDGIYWKFSFDAPSFISWNAAKSLYHDGKIRFNKGSIDFGGKSKISLFMTQFKKADATDSIKGILDFI